MGEDTQDITKADQEKPSMQDLERVFEEIRPKIVALIVKEGEVIQSGFLAGKNLSQMKATTNKIAFYSGLSALVEGTLYYTNGRLSEKEFTDALFNK